MRMAQVLSDSFRRNRATAKSAPSFSIAAVVAGGNCIRARAVLGMQIDMFENCHFIHIYIYIKWAIWFGRWIDMNWGQIPIVLAWIPDRG
jgi:hypothetical protein